MSKTRAVKGHQEENCWCAQGWNELQETWWKDDSCWCNSLKIEKISNHSIWSFMEDLVSWVRMIIRHGRKHCSQIKPKSNFLTLTWPATFRGREMLSMTRGTLTIFVLRVREDQWERPLNRTMYYRFSDENLLPSARTVKVMDQSWQWPKTHKRLKMKHTKVIPRPGIACLYTSVL